MTALAHDHLVGAARTTPDRAAIVFGDETHTFAGIDRSSDALAAWLQRSGLRRGDRVAVATTPATASDATSSPATTQPSSQAETP